MIEPKYELLGDVEKSASRSSSDTVYEHDLKADYKENQHARSWLRSNVAWYILGVAFVLLNIGSTLGYTVWLHRKYPYDPQHAYSPVRDAISYTAHTFDTTLIYLRNGTLNTKKPSKFSGYPRPELETAWHNLTNHLNIRLEQHELGEFANDDTLVKLSDGSGYFATLTVFHGLHCIERLHHWLYKEHYYQGLSTENERLLRQHTEHCVDWLRQYVQCNADTTIIPMHWNSEKAAPVAIDSGKHQCVNWDPIKEWVEDHWFDAFTPGLVVHPVFGPSYEKAKPDKIGFTDSGELVHSGHVGI